MGRVEKQTLRPLMKFFSEAMALSDSQEPFLKYASYNFHCVPAAPHLGSTGLAQHGDVHHQSHKVALGTKYGKAT